MQSGDLLFVNSLNVHNEGEHVYYLALVVAIAIHTLPAQTPPYLVPIRYHCVSDGSRFLFRCCESGGILYDDNSGSECMQSTTLGNFQIWCPHRKGERGHGKADVIREVARILLYKSVPNPNADEGGKVKFKNFADILPGSFPAVIQAAIKCPVSLLYGKLKMVMSRLGVQTRIFVDIYAGSFPRRSRALTLGGFLPDQNVAVTLRFGHKNAFAACLY